MNRQERIIQNGSDIIGLIEDRVVEMERNLSINANFLATKRESNRVCCLSGEPMETIPFTNTETPMPLEIRFFYQITEMSPRRVNIYVNGYGLPITDFDGVALNQNQKKVKIALHIGVPTRIIRESYRIDEHLINLR